MISVLIVDDDQNKVRRIREAIESTLAPAEVSIQVAGSVARAVTVMREANVSLLIVDLNVPARSDSPPVGDGGVRLLRKLSRSHALKVPAHILGLTEYPHLRAQCENDFAAEAWPIVTFSWTSDEWEEPIRRKLLYISAGEDDEGAVFETDLAIITALDRVELEAVLLLDSQWKVEQEPNDPTIYHRTTFRRGAKVISVTAVAAPEMGMAAAAAITTKVICRYRPRYVVMVGIAAGVSGQFGDVIVADRAWDYGSGKIRTTERRRRRFEPAPSQVPIDQVVKARLSMFLRRPEILDGIRKEWKGCSVPKVLAAKMGPFASGAAVVSARGVITSLVKQHRKLAAVEMETYGVLLAAQMAAAPKPGAFAVKSICDFGDKRKGDAYQKYAAYTSARFVKEFALEHLAQD